MGLYRGLLLAHLLTPLTKAPYDSLEKLSAAVRNGDIRFAKDIHEKDGIWYLQNLFGAGSAVMHKLIFARLHIAKIARVFIFQIANRINCS